MSHSDGVVRWLFSVRNFRNTSGIRWVDKVVAGLRFLPFCFLTNLYIIAQTLQLLLQLRNIKVFCKRESQSNPLPKNRS